MKKISFIFIILILFYNIKYISDYQLIIKETTYLWFTVLIPSIMPMYVLSNLLLAIPNCFNMFYYLLNPLYRFENATSTTIFILSFLTSNPTTSIIIVNSLNQNLISRFEANRLMRSTSHFSFTFIYLIAGKKFLLIFISLFLASSLIYRFSYFKGNKRESSSFVSNLSYQNVINKIIDDGYQVLLKILYIMLTIGLLTNCINHLFPYKIIKIISAFLEITIGSTYLKFAISNNFVKYLLITLLFSFNGVSIIFQTQNVVKNLLSIKNFLKFRFIHMSLSAFLFTIMWII